MRSALIEDFMCKVVLFQYNFSIGFTTLMPSLLMLEATSVCSLAKACMEFTKS